MNIDDTKLIKQKILASDVISFDVFDTLLVRSFLNGKDIWKSIENQFKCIGFYNSRCASDNGGYENIDQQYAKMENCFQICKDAECAIEISTCNKRNDIIELFDFAKENNKICIITSDMYLPKDVIQKMLTKIGITGYSKLYLSNDIKARKDNGSVFEIIKYDFLNKKIIHIGDNLNSDSKIPLQHGINGVHIKTYYQEFIDHFPFVASILKSDCSLHMKKIVAALSIAFNEYLYLKNYDISYWNKIGCVCGTVVVTAFCQKILSVCKERNTTCILFVARDGYILKKVIDKQLNVKTLYVYAPRQLLNTNDAILLEQYKNYVKSLNIDSNNSIIVDTVTGKFTSQQLLSKNIGNNVYLLAYVNCGGKKLDFGQSFCNTDTRFNHLIEFMCMAPHQPISHVKDNLPIYITDLSEYEVNKINAYPEIEDAIDFCANKVLSILNLTKTDITMKDVICILTEFTKNLTAEDRQNFNNIKNGNADHKSGYKNII